MTFRFCRGRGWGSLAVAAILVLFAHAGAQATPTTWTLSNVTYADGATAAGTFDYDASSNTYSSVDVTLSNGTLYSSFHFGTSNVNFKANNRVSFCSTGTGCANADYVYLIFASALTDIAPNAGPTSLAVTGHSYGVTNGSGFITGSSAISSGSVTANAQAVQSAPEPTSLALAGLAMLATVGVRARRSKTRVA